MRPASTPSPQELSLSSALDHSTAPIVITDCRLDEPGPVIEYVNPAFERMTGYSKAQLLGRSPRMLQGRATDRTMLDRLRRLLETDGDFHGEAMNYRRNGEAYQVEWIITPIRKGRSRPTHWISIQRDLTEADRGHAAEAQGRVRNLLGTVQAIAARTFQEEGGVAKLKRFSRRLETLAEAQAGPEAHGPSVRRLLDGEIERRRIAPGRVFLAGSQATLPRSRAELFSVAVHELFDNAVRHGALSGGTGRVSVKWWTRELDASALLLFRWRETGGSTPVRPGWERGFGLELIESALPYSLGAVTRIDMGADGFSCSIDLPLAERRGTRPASPTSETLRAPS